MELSSYANFGRAHPDMPVLVISGLEEAEDAYEGLNVTFRLKPLVPDLLLATVHDLLNKN